MARTGVLLLASLLADAGCSGKQIFRSDGYYHDVYTYRVRYVDGRFSLPSEEWQVDNYEVDAEGNLTKRKPDDEYQTEIAVDTDGDGEGDHRLSLPRYDLLLSHRGAEGRMWIRTVPVSEAAHQTDLRVLAERYVQEVASSGEVVVEIGQKRQSVRPEVATRILTSSPEKLDGLPAHEVTFEVADVGHAQLNEGSHWRRVHVLVVRAPFAFLRDDLRLPVLMIVGYANETDDFLLGQGDFKRFLESIDFMSDTEIINGLSGEVFACLGSGAAELEVLVHIEADGRAARALARPPGSEVPTLREVSPFGCVSRLLRHRRFNATGEARSFVHVVRRDDSAGIGF